MDCNEFRAGQPNIRLSTDRIMETSPGDVIWHPGGFLVEIVRCYPGNGYWFWHRVDEATLSRQGELEGGPWLAANDPAQSSEGWARRVVELLAANQARRETVVAQVQQLHAEMIVLGEISTVLYGNVIKNGRKMLP